MEQTQAVELARSALYPKGLPHPDCDAVGVVFDPVARRYCVHFPIIWWVNRNTLRKLADRREAIPPAPGVQDPPNCMVEVLCDTGRARVIR
jgi:hypothetical protein